MEPYRLLLVYFSVRLIRMVEATTRLYSQRDDDLDDEKEEEEGLLIMLQLQ